MARRASCVGFVFPLLLGLGFAQTADSNNQQVIALLIQQIKDLQKQTLELQARLEALEATTKAPPTNSVGTTNATPPVTPVPAGETAQQTSTEPAPGVLASLHALSRIQWRGFGEADYKVLDQRQPETGTYGFVPGSAGNFYTGDFGLFLTAKISEKASALSEMVFEEGDAQTYNVDLRRLLLKYDYNDHLKMSFGRYQTNIGYYNWAFLSAAWLQTTADRPLAMEYAADGGILPTQAIGVSVIGTIPSGRLGLNYVAEYGSSDTVRPDINGDGLFNDENNGNHVNAGFFLQPDFVQGLRVGGSIYHDRISDLVFLAAGTAGIGPPSISTIPTNEEYPPNYRWGQTIVNGHIIYVTPKIEILNEGFLIRHALIGGTMVYNTPAFYTQFSRKFGAIRPFFRYQYLNASPLNLIYDDVGLRYGPSFGARYDVNDFIAFKVQLDHTARRGEPDLNGLHLQLSFTF
jgi:hypothetical protein